MRSAPRLRKNLQGAAPDRDSARTRAQTEAGLRLLNEALEQQARQIAESLHNEAAQVLTCAHVALTRATRGLPAAARARVQAVRQHLDCIEEQLRRVAHELHPRILDDLGLVRALEFVAEGVGKRRGIAIAIDASIRTSLPIIVEATLYRLVQEALTNVGRHARATRVRVQITHTPRSLRCTIEDDGIGFDPAVLATLAGRGLGIRASRERLAALGGTLAIASARGRGTQLVITIPLDI